MLSKQPLLWRTLQQLSILGIFCKPASSFTTEEVFLVMSPHTWMMFVIYVKIHIFCSSITCQWNLHSKSMPKITHSHKSAHKKARQVYDFSTRSPDLYQDLFSETQTHLNLPKFIFKFKYSQKNSRKLIYLYCRVYRIQCRQWHSIELISLLLKNKRACKKFICWARNTNGYK